jgi:integrase
MVLTDAQRQSLVARNVAEHVDSVAVGHREVATYTTAEVDALLSSIANDRIGHAWELALCGLRRGEIAGLRWSDVNLGGKTLSIANNRVDAGGKAVENDPKSAMSRRICRCPIVWCRCCAQRRRGRRPSGWRPGRVTAQANTS